MDISPRRRHAISTLLAIFLAVESVSAVAAAAGTTVAAHATANASAQAIAAASPVGLVYDATGAAETPFAMPAAAPSPTPVPWFAPMPVPGAIPAATPPPAPKVTPKPKATPKATTKPVTRAVAKPVTRTVAKPAPKPTVRAVAYAGRNHVWIPSLGVNRSVAFFSCSRTTRPDNYVYRWGCAGTNNVYLMGHASSVFQPLHDAYVSGRLRVGMRVWYADGSGTVRQYSVRWWKLTKPTTDASWAWATQSVPSMTLQTCVGANSEYRLMVRLVQVGG